MSKLVSFITAWSCNWKATGRTGECHQRNQKKKKKPPSLYVASGLQSNKLVVHKLRKTLDYILEWAVLFLLLTGLCCCGKSWRLYSPLKSSWWRHTGHSSWEWWSPTRADSTYSWNKPISVSSSAFPVSTQEEALSCVQLSNIITYFYL